MKPKGRTGDLFASLPVAAAVAPASVPAPVPAPLRRRAASRPQAVPPPPATGLRTGGAPRQLWIALHLPLLALPVGASTTEPVAVIESGAQGQQFVAACNAPAARLGIVAAMGLNAAIALAPRLSLLARDPALEARRLEDVARLATAFTPFVCIESATDLLLEVRASQRLFGGLEALLDRLRGELARIACVARLGTAPTPTAAAWLARARDERPVATVSELGGRLNALPLGVTGWPADVQETLVRLGLRRLGDLVRLPRAGLARRFTPELVAELDEAYGRAAAVRRRHVLPERFRLQLDLESEVESVAFLEPVLHRLLDGLGTFLRERDAGVASCLISLGHRARPATRFALRRSHAAGQGADWHRLLYERLTHLSLPAPVVSVSLRSAVALPLATRSSLLPGLPDPLATGEAARALLDRLRARLGEGAVTGIGLVAEHRPEAASRPMHPVPPGRAAPVERVPGPPRPLWLLPAPEPLHVRSGKPWLDGPLVLESGPERIESGWWDGAEACRDYYVARAGGARVWIYRDHAVPDGWYWHGAYA